MNVTKQRLDFWTCFFLDSGSHLVARHSLNETTNNGYSFSNETFEKYYDLYCDQHGTYLLRTTEEFGKVVALLLFILTFVMGLLGIISNGLNIMLLRKSFQGTESFKEALLMLSGIELVVSAATTGFSYYIILILQIWNRSKATMWLFLISRLIYTVTRTMSIYVTFLITVERFVVVAFPKKAKIIIHDKLWKSRIILAGTILFCFLINLPGLFKYTIVKNEFERLDSQEKFNITMDFSTAVLNFPFLTQTFGVFRKIPAGLKTTLLALDYFVPLPILLLFNGLLYFKIYEWNNKRGILGRGQKRDLNTAKMFSVIVLVLLLCHSVSSIVFVVTRVENVIFRELLLLQNLTVVFGTSSNFIIYYWFGLSFRREFWGLANNLFGAKFDYVRNKYNEYSKQIPTISQRSVT